VLSVSNACAASAYAIGLAQEMLDSGECDLVIAIGAEGYSRVALGSFNRLGAVDAQGCRPFAAGRAGTAFGEGAAALVLERPDSAAARGAAPVADLLGSAFSSDAGHATAPDAHGAQSARTFAEARAAAGRHAAPIAAVVPHGTGTQLNDAVEARLLSDAFGAAGVPMYSLKALIGHSGGAAGALAAVSAIEIARHGIVPGNVDVGELDPELPVVLNAEPEPIAGPVAVNAYAFGGNNATLIFGSRS
jgi:3-oxoacyl-[acyl-carrier-protein] synthase II